MVPDHSAIVSVPEILAFLRCSRVTSCSSALAGFCVSVLFPLRSSEISTGANCGNSGVSQKSRAADEPLFLFLEIFLAFHYTQLIVKPFQCTVRVFPALELQIVSLRFLFIYFLSIQSESATDSFPKSVKKYEK